MKASLRATLSLMLATISSLSIADEPLPSWSDSASRTAIMDFVAEVTDEESDGFVPASDRIAVFDNDGTLWAEQPAYFQALYAADMAKAKLKANPSLAAESPFKELAEGGLGAVASGGHEALFGLLEVSHANISNAEFQASVAQWLESARHPTSGRPYTAMVYQPMLELLDYLRANGFSTWIVSGGGVSFIRVWAEDAYGIPKNQVIGSRNKLSFEETASGPVFMRDEGIAHINDGPGKPVGIQQVIGQRPIMAVGNSDGDFEMLSWSTSLGPSLGVLIHHTDEEREWAYDRDSSIGRLDRGLDESEERGWIVVDMKSDWKQVFPE